MAQRIRWEARRASARIELAPRMRAGRLQRARKTPTTMTREMTIGERPRVTSFVGASAAPSQAPAVSPEKIPRSCRERERVERVVSAAAGGGGLVSGSTPEGG